MRLLRSLADSSPLTSHFRHVRLWQLPVWPWRTSNIPASYWLILWSPRRIRHPSAELIYSLSGHAARAPTCRHIQELSPSPLVKCRGVLALGQANYIMHYAAFSLKKCKEGDGELFDGCRPKSMGIVHISSRSQDDQTRKGSPPRGKPNRLLGSCSSVHYRHSHIQWLEQNQYSRSNKRWCCCDCSCNANWRPNALNEFTNKIIVPALISGGWINSCSAVVAIRLFK